MRTTFVVIPLLLVGLLLVGCKAKTDAGTKEVEAQAKTQNEETTMTQNDPLVMPDLDSFTWQQIQNGPEYTVLKEGTGDPVAAGAMTSMHYTGWLVDGNRFDSSIPRGEALVFKLGAGQVIRGWDMGIEGMKRGEKRVLRIPPELGYGQRGYPPVIPQNATLIFYVELVDFK